MEKKDFNIVFIHRRAKFPVVYAAEHAASLGYDVTVIGEPGWEFRGCKNEDLYNYSNNRKEFRDLYRHISPNKPEYESFCFERWIILRNYVKEHNLRNVIYVDSDALIYDGIEIISEISSGKILDTPYLNFFLDIGCLDLLVGEIFRTYRSDEVINSFISKGVRGDVYYTDMLLFPQLTKVYPDSAKEWSKQMELLGFDRNINLRGEFQSHFAEVRGIKKIYNKRPNPIGIKVDGEEIAFRFLHFQGRAKSLMRCYLNGKVESYSESWWPIINDSAIKLAFDEIG
jgi:hypothetical protein